MSSKSAKSQRQPEALAGLAAAAKAGGVKAKTDGLTATSSTAPQRSSPEDEVDAATKILREGATGKKQGAAAAVKKLPDRARRGST